MTLSRAKSLGILFLAALMSLGLFSVQHGFQPGIEPDSQTYLEFNWSSLQSVLSNVRTFGYPLFLSVLRCAISDLRAIVFAHWLALLLAAVVFQEGLIAAGYRRQTALLCAITLLFSRGLMTFGSSIIADSLASSLAIAAAGCFLACTASPACWIAWAGLIGSTFLCYQTRPAYLFLIPLWPVVSIAADRLILRRDANWRTILRRGGGFAAVTLVPFVLFCTVRWTVVGHWGLVSFGGYNLIGVVGQFLEPASVESLPDHLQPLARGMLEKRAQVPDYESPTSFLVMEQVYVPTIWEIAVPTAQELHGNDAVTVNRVLTELSGRLLRQNLPSYGRWLVWNGIHAVKQVVLLTVTDPGTRLLCLLLFAAQVRSLWRGPPIEGLPSTPIELSAQQQTAAIRFREMHLLFWTAIAFAATKALLVILVEPANDRYMTGAMVLLPAALAVFLLHLLEARTE